MTLANSGWQRAAAYQVFYLALLCMIGTIVVYYPGYMSPDSVVMLGQARTAVTSNVYSPLMSYAWRMTDLLIPGPGGMLLLQNIIYWMSLAFIAYCATPNRLLGCLFVCTGLWIPTFAMLGTIWKDVGMQGFLLAAVAAMLYALHRHRLWPLAVAVMFLFFACGYRQNGIAAAVPVLIMVVYYFSKLLPVRFAGLHRRLVERQCLSAFCVAVAGIVLWILMSGLTLLNSYRIADAKLWSASMVYDLVAISVQANVNYLPPYVNRANALTVEDLKHMYSPLHANSLFVPESRQMLGVNDPLPDKIVNFTLTEAEARSLKFYWLTTVLDHFGSYLRHRCLITERLLVLVTRQPWYPYITGIDPNPFGLTFHRSRLNIFVTKATEYAAFQTPLYSAWMYYLVVTACVFVSFLWPFAYARIVQSIGVSVWLYFLSIFMFGMSGDFRYNIWALTCAPLCVFLLLCGGGRQATDPTA
jgi:hypothetical protein